MKYNTDKFAHGLIEIYEKKFNHLREKPINLLEIGVAKGGSLKYWASFFNHERSKILGLDRHIPSCEFSENVSLINGDQNDIKLLKQTASDHGPFNIIIDDASHFTRETSNCFNSLWSEIKSDGYYVIEDWGVGYFPGKSEYNGMAELIAQLLCQVPTLGVSDIYLEASPLRSILFLKKGKAKWGPLNF